MIRYARPDDLDILCEYDSHVTRSELATLISQKRVIILLDGNDFAGWLRYNLFWDNTPFMNMLYLLEGRRGQGFGGQLTAFWEAEMKLLGYDRVMTSSLSNEQGQFFYRKHGYIDCGSLLLPGEPLEIVFVKDI